MPNSFSYINIMFSLGLLDSKIWDNLFLIAKLSCMNFAKAIRRPPSFVVSGLTKLSWFVSTLKPWMLDAAVQYSSLLKRVFEVHSVIKCISSPTYFALHELQVLRFTSTGVLSAWLTLFQGDGNSTSVVSVTACELGW